MFGDEIKLTKRHPAIGCRLREVQNIEQPFDLLKVR